jgi:DNA polymerase elongation subunit (family B)
MTKAANPNSMFISSMTKGRKVMVWTRSSKNARRQLMEYDTPYYFYRKDEQGQHTDIFGNKVKRFDFDDRKVMRGEVERLESFTQIYESDIDPSTKVLSDNYYKTKVFMPNVTFYDIEVDYDPEVGFSSILNPYAPVNAVALFNNWEDIYKVLVVPPQSFDVHAPDFSMKKFREAIEAIDPVQRKYEIIFFDTEKELLKEYLNLITETDILCGWNSEYFDDPYMGKRIEMVLGPADFSRLSFEKAGKPKWKETERFNEKTEVIKMQGRSGLDYLDVMKKFEPGEKPSWTLEDISEEMLPDLKKLDYDGSLAELYNNDFIRFVRYNLRDTEILDGFEKKLGYIALANEIVHDVCVNFDAVLGTTRATDQAMTNFCHFELGGLIVPNAPVETEEGRIAGAYVLPPKVGMHKNIASVDLTSLYPSVIRSLGISPDTIVGQFLEKYKSSEEIIKNSDVMLTLVWDKTFDKEGEITAPAHVWNAAFEQSNWTVSGYGTVFNSNKEGVLPKLLTFWFDGRVEAKTNMSKAYKSGDEELGNFWNRIQLVKKVQLNAAYGALCNAYFRYYDLRLGESVTSSARLILRHQCAQSNYYMGMLMKEPEPKYEVEGEHIIYGDTDSTYFLTHAPDLKTAETIGDNIGKMVNHSFPQFMEDTFKCNEVTKIFMNTDREVIGASGIFIAKKMYLIHVVNDEGKVVDKLKLMGIALKRSALPKYVKEFLKDTVEAYVKGGTFDDFRHSIIEIKKYVTTTDVMNIGVTIGIKNLKQYTESLLEDKKEHDDRNDNDSVFKNADPTDFTGVKTILPGHVAAAILWNTYLDEHNDLESPRVKSGDKVQTLRLKKEHKGKFNAIALPKTLKHLPQWFHDDVMNDIDRTAMQERLIYNSLKAILGAINMVVPDEQDLVLKELIGADIDVDTKVEKVKKTRIKKEVDFEW